MLIFQSSGNKEFDKSAIDTISKNNYAPLPGKYTNDKLLILFTFNIINSQTIPGQNYLQSSKYPYSNIFNCIYLTKSLRILKNIQNKRRICLVERIQNNTKYRFILMAYKS